MINEEYVWTLVSEKLSGEASGESLQKLEKLLKANPEMQQRVQLLESLWKTSGDKSPHDRKEAFLKHLRRMAEKIN